MRYVRTSRTLNENSNLLGLTVTDLLGLTGTYSLLQLIFFSMGLELFLLPIMLIMSVTLMQIRLKHRRGIIRDLLTYSYIKIFYGGVFNDESSSSFTSPD